MTNKCDLDEMKHIAQQKFLELVESGVEWQREGYDGAKYSDWRIHRDYSFSSGVYTLFVGLVGKTVWYREHPRKRTVKTTKAGNPDKRDDAKAEKEYALATIAYNADPMVIAVQRVRGALTAQDEQKRLVERQKAQEASCKALQEALKGTATTLATSTYKEHTEAPVQSEGLLNRLLRRMGL